MSAKLTELTQNISAYLAQRKKLPGFVLLLLGIIEFIPDWASREDFWVHLSETNPGLIAILITVIRLPLTGATLFGLGFLYLFYVHGVIPRNGSKPETQLPQEPEYIGPPIPQPDMPLKDLFHVLAPRGFPTDAERDRLAREIMDKFAAGYLKVWGRKMMPSGQRLTLAEIPKEEWRRAEFHFTWLLSDRAVGRQMANVSCHIQDGEHRYCDLQIRREIAETCWPNDQIALNAASRILYEAVEEAEITSSVVGVSYSSPDVALDHFKYVLLARDVVLSGVRQPSSKARPVPKELRASLLPVSGTSNLAFLQASQGSGFGNVTIARRELMRMCREYVGELKRLERAQL